MNTPLDQKYWDQRYQNKQTGWDMKQVSPPFETFINSLKNKDLNFLIPGCGNAYEAEYLVNNGFTNVTLIDISPSLCEQLAHKFMAYPTVNVICDDFFTHNGQYDYIFEQTFFCALNPSLRIRYVEKMYTLLKPEGHLVGLLFDTQFKTEGPPFGGSKAEYLPLFKTTFAQAEMTECSHSHPARQGTEIWIDAVKL